MVDDRHIGFSKPPRKNAKQANGDRSRGGAEGGAGGGAGGGGGVSDVDGFGSCMLMKSIDNTKLYSE